jgi:hypothetical protein
MFELHRMSCQRCLQGFSLVHSGIRQNRVLSRYNNIFSNRSSRLFTVQKTNSRETITKPNFWVRWTAPREMPPRYTLRWYGEVLLICTVFGITGTSTMLLVRRLMFSLVFALFTSQLVSLQFLSIRSRGRDFSSPLHPQRPFHTLLLGTTGSV